MEPDGSTVKAILGSFKALKSFAKFDGEVSAEEASDVIEDAEEDESGDEENTNRAAVPKLGLSYTINLNLPATSDIAVFNAIFRSLKEHLLK